MQAIISFVDLGFNIWLEGDKIRYKQIRGQVDPSTVESLLAEIKSHKEEAIQYLQSVSQAVSAKEKKQEAVSAPECSHDHKWTIYCPFSIC